jgi:hypothetical protein
VSRYDRFIEATARTRAGAWFFVRVATYVDRYVMRWTAGRVSSGIGSRFHRTAALVVTRGAKSGQERVERRIPVVVLAPAR